VIDGGRSGKVLLARLGRHIPFWDRQIETLIATHPDSDHIGGFPELLRAYRVLSVFTNGDTSETETSRLFETLAAEETGEMQAIARGTEIVFPEGGTLTLEYPLRPLAEESGTESNEGSIVARFQFGETSFLLTGDLPGEEKALPEERPVTVLKVAHHGSKYSSSAAFLERIGPEEAVLSVGENSYGHPDPGVLARLRERSVLVRRTDEEGDIRYRCLELTSRCTYAPAR